MASMQSHKPADHHTWPQPTKPNSGTCNSGTCNNESRFSTKVKEMANSVTKVFTEHKNQGNNGNRKDGNCFPRKTAGGDHHNKKKKEKHDMMKPKKKNRDGKSSHSSSDCDD